jgi:hypothetical protein
VTEQEASRNAPIVLRISSPIVPKGNLNIALPMTEGLSVGEELAEALREDGFDATVAVPAGGGWDIMLMVLGAAGGATGIAKVLTAFFSKNQHRKITIKEGDKEFEAQGLSLRQLETLIRRVLDELREDGA